MFENDKLIGYHGTDTATASVIVSGRIDVNRGGGELGRGFYLQEYLHEAREWAHHKFSSSGAVAKTTIPETSFIELDPVVLSRQQAIFKRLRIKTSGQARVFLFGRNAVWAPIVGSSKVRGDQFKFETNSSQTLLNGASVDRSIV